MKTETSESKDKWIFFQGTQIKPGETWAAHGLFFEKGTVQKVSPEVFEYIKVMRGFTEVIKVDDKAMDFPKSKRIRRTK